MIRIVLAEDQAMLRDALCRLLSMETDIEIVGDASDGLKALRMVQRLKPDILVTDIEMPGLSGIELAEKLARDGIETAVVIITTFSRSGYFTRAVQSGVKGFLLKDAPSENLYNAIRTVAAQGTYFADEFAKQNFGNTDPLTNSDRRILRLVEQGKSNREIAGDLNLSAGTVRNYLAEIFSKLGVSSRIEAFRAARENGWL